MDNNLKNIGKIAELNKDLDKIDKVLERKMLHNKKYTELLEKLIENTLENYHNIIKNLDER